MQLFVTGPSRLEWRDAPPAQIVNESDAIIRPLAVARCDLDPLVIAGHPLTPPHAIGHEFAGEVIALGSAVRTLTIGDRVVSSFVVSCGACLYCARGAHHGCRAVEKPAYFGFGALGHDWGGAVADTLRIPFADSMLVRLPQSVSAAAAASAGDNLADAFRAVVPHLRDIPGGPVAIVGGSSASIGLYAVAWARRAGASIVDYFDLDRRRLELAERMGARVHEAPAPGPGRTYAIAVHAGGLGETLLATLRAMDFGGRITTTFINAPSVAFPYLEAFTTGVTLTVGDQNTRNHLPEIVAALADGFDPTKIIGEVHPWLDAADAFLASASKIVITREECA